MSMIQCSCLSEECPCDEPEAVGDGELVLHDLVLCNARVRVVPLVGREARHHEQGERHHHVRGQDVTGEKRGTGVQGYQLGNFWD